MVVSQDVYLLSAATQQGRPPLLYIEGGDFEPGSTLATPFVVVMPESAALAELSVRLNFDSAVVEPIAAIAGTPWTARLEPGNEQGAADVSASSGGSVCAARSRCSLFTIEWKAVGLGSSNIVVDFARVSDTGGRSFDLSPVPGVLTVRDLVAGERTTGVGGQPPASDSTGLDGADGLGFGLTAVVAMLVVGSLVLGAAAFGARAVASRGATQGPLQEAAPVPKAVEWPERPLLGDGIERYFERVQQLGQVTHSRMIGDFDHDLAITSALHPVADDE